MKKSNTVFLADSCVGALTGNAASQARNLHIEVTGDLVERARMIEFARSYLGDAGSVS